MLLLHHREPAEQLAQTRLGRFRCRLGIEGSTAELNLESDANRLQSAFALKRPRIKRLELAPALRARSVRERKPLAHLRAASATPLQGRNGAADVLLFALQRLMALGADHDRAC
jgi:hypothetical protein